MFFRAYKLEISNFLWTFSHVGIFHRVHTEWQWPISGVHFIMTEKSALAGEGGGGTLQCTL